MKEHFQKQIAKANRLTFEKIESMRQDRITTLGEYNIPPTEKNITPKSYYKEPYNVSDVILYFIYNSLPESKTIGSISMQELDRLSEDFEFIRMDGLFPVLKKGMID